MPHRRLRSLLTDTLAWASVWGLVAAAIVFGPAVRELVFRLVP